MKSESKKIRSTIKSVMSISFTSKYCENCIFTQKFSWKNTGIYFHLLNNYTNSVLHANLESWS